MVEIPRRSASGGRRGGGIRLPGAEDVPTVAAPRDPGLRVPQGAFGEGDAAAMADIGAGAAAFSDATAQAGARIREREDLIQRVRDTSQFGEQARQLFDDAAKQDLTRTDTLKAFRSALGDLKKKTLEAHGGSRSSRDRLDASLLQDSDRFATMLDAQSLAARDKALKDGVSGVITDLSKQAYDGIGEVRDLYPMLNDRLAEFAPGLSEEDRQAFAKTGRASLAQSRLQGVLDRASITDAASLDTLESSIDGFREDLGEESFRKMKGQIGQKRRLIVEEKLKADREALGKAQEFQQQLQLEAAKQAGALRLEYAKQAGAVNLEREKQSQARQNLMGGEFNTAQARSIVLQGAQAYAQKRLPPEQESLFEQALSATMTASRDDKGNLVLMATPDVANAIAMRPDRWAATPQWRALGLPEPKPGDGQNKTPWSQAGTQQSPYQAAVLAPPQDPGIQVRPEDTLLGTANRAGEQATGGVGFIRRQLENMPFVGNVTGSTVSTEAKQKMMAVSQSVTAAFRATNRLTGAEWENLRTQVLALEPELFTNIQAYKARLSESYRQMWIMESQSRQLSQSRSLSAQDRGEHAAKAEELRVLRSRLAPTAQTMADAAQRFPENELVFVEQPEDGGEPGFFVNVRQQNGVKAQGAAPKPKG